MLLWTFGEVAGSSGIIVLAYVTAQIVHLKARGIARWESHGLWFWREISCARPRMFGGKVVSPPHSGFCVLTGIDNKLTVCQ